MDVSKNKKIILDFIEKVWNEEAIDLLDDYVAKDFADYSLPPGFPEGIAGTKMWISATGKSFRHHTVIEDMLAEEEKVCIRIRMELHHIGEWRGYAPTGARITTIGYRFFALKNDRIAKQWALIDGNRIEQEISGVVHGCRLAV